MASCHCDPRRGGSNLIRISEQDYCSQTDFCGQSHPIIHLRIIHLKRLCFLRTPESSIIQPELMTIQMVVSRACLEK